MARTRRARVVRGIFILAGALVIAWAVAVAAWLADFPGLLLAVPLGEGGLEDGIAAPWRKFLVAGYWVTFYFHTNTMPPDPVVSILVRRGIGPLVELGLFHCAFIERPIWRDGDTIRFPACASVASYDLPTGQVAYRR